MAFGSGLLAAAFHHAGRRQNPWSAVDRHVKHVDVPIPYAPTPTGAAAAAAAGRMPHHDPLALQHLVAPLAAPAPVSAPHSLISPSLRHTLHRLSPISAEEGLAIALTGQMPSEHYRKVWGPRTFRKIHDVALNVIGSKEGLKEDPIAEALLAAGLTAGLGGLASGLAKGGEVGAEAAGAAAGADAADQTASPVEKLLKGLSDVRSAPERAIEKLSTGEGRRAAAADAARLSGRQARAHPLISADLGLAAAHAGGVHTAPTDIAAALLTGHVNALFHNPIGTAETTGRALAGSIASIAGLGYSAGQSAVEGDPRAFLNTAGSQLHGLEQIGGHLLSGNSKEVQEAVEKEAGLSFLVPAPALKRFGGADIPGTGVHIPGYEDVRSGVRDFAKRRREAIEATTGIPMRHGPEEQNVFGILEARTQRRDLAHDAQRQVAPEHLAAGRVKHQMVKAARKIPGARSFRNIHGFEPADAASTLAEYGVVDQKGLDALRAHGPAADSHLEGDVNLHAVLEHFEKHPGLVDHPELQKLAHEIYGKSTETLPLQLRGRGKRAAALSQAQLFGIRDAVDRVPVGARRFTDAVDRTGAWKDLTDAEKRAKGLRTEARTLLAQAQKLRETHHGADAALDPRPVKLTGEAHAKYAAARQLEQRNKAFRKELHPYSRPGAAVSSRARRKLYDNQLVDEMVAETNARAAEHGMVPGKYTHHARLREEGEKVGSSRGSSKPTRVQHVRRADEFSLAANDAVDRSFSSLLEGSVERPRVQSGLRRFARNTFSKYAVKLKAGKGKIRVTEEQFSQAIRDGEISEKGFVWVPDSEIKQPFIDPSVDPGSLASVASRRLKGELTREDIAKQRVGAKGVVVPREVYTEYAAQINPKRYIGEQIVNAVSKTGGRVLLFSPAWVASQIVAEGIPIVIANPRLLNPAYIAKLHKRLKEFNDLHPQEAISWAATMGEAPIRTASPRELQGTYKPQHSHFYDGARAIEHNPIGRAVFSTVRMRPLILFDQWRQGKYRQILAAAEVDRGLNSWMGGLQGALGMQKRISAELKDLDPVEQLHALTTPKYQRDLVRMQDYVENILGNWTSFTRFERRFAPAAVFYGFIRYAFRWPFTFAKEHPISATINYFLAQQNANQVEEILHGKPAQFYQYANPVIEGPHGEKSWLPGGSRIAPGLSAPAQGLLGGSVPEAAVSSANPLYAAILGGAFGVNSFGEHDEGSGALGIDWSLAAQELITTPPLVRLIGIDQSESPTAKKLRELDPNKKARSFLDPALPQSAADARESNEIIKALDEGGSSSSSSSSSAPSNPFSTLDSSSSSNPFSTLGP